MSGVKHGVDCAAALGIIGTLMGYLPQIAALFGIMWYSMQMYDWIKKKFAKNQKRRKADRLAVA